MLALSFLKSRLFSLIKNTEFSSTDFLVSSSLCGHLSQRANNHALTPLHLPQPGWEIWVNLSFSLRPPPPLSFLKVFQRKEYILWRKHLNLGQIVPLLPFWIPQMVSPILRQRRHLPCLTWTWFADPVVFFSAFWFLLGNGLYCPRTNAQSRSIQDIYEMSKENTFTCPSAINFLK